MVQQAAITLSGGAPSISCLLCARCKWPLIAKSDIIAERAQDVWTGAVYSYELEVLGEDTWVYSATNPNANRFDVIKCGASCGQAILHESDKFTDLHSWFPAYEWSMASCCSCGEHLGWAFSLKEPAQGTPLAGGEASESETKEAKKERPSAANDSPTEGGATRAQDDEGEKAEDVLPEPKASSAASSQDQTKATGQEAEGAAASQVAESAPRPVNFFGIIVTKCVADEHYSLSAYDDAMAAGELRRNELRERRELQLRLPALVNAMDNRVLAMNIMQGLVELEANGQQLTMMQLRGLVGSLEEGAAARRNGTATGNTKKNSKGRR
jgi:hypothetical protein